MNGTLDNQVLPTTLHPGDARIPATVSVYFDSFDRAITAVSPVARIGGIEWMLYDAEHHLVDVLYDGIRNKGSY